MKSNTFQLSPLAATLAYRGKLGDQDANRLADYYCREGFALASSEAVICDTAMLQFEAIRAAHACAVAFSDAV